MKTVVPYGYRGFESHSLRQLKDNLCRLNSSGILYEIYQSEAQLSLKYMCNCTVGEDIIPYDMIVFITAHDRGSVVCPRSSALGEPLCMDCFVRISLYEKKPLGDAERFLLVIHRRFGSVAAANPRSCQGFFAN